MVDRKHRRKSSSVVRPHLDRQSALAGRRQHLFEVEDLCRALRPAEPGESGGSENDRIVFAAFDFPDARVDVPTYIRDAQVSAQCGQLCSPARAAGADDGGGRKRGQPRVVAAYECVSRVFAREHGGDCETRSLLDGQVLQAVHGNIDLMLEQSALEFDDEHTTTPDLAQGRGRTVAGGADRAHFEGRIGDGRMESGEGDFGLPER